MSGIAQLPKSFLRIKGLDAAKFLNGLITTRLVPNVVKKKQHTISENENQHLQLAQTVDLAKNWGVMHEDIYDPAKTMWVRRDGIFLMLLNSKGRVQAELFNYPTPFHTTSEPLAQLAQEGPNYLLEIDPKYERLLMLLLRIHKLSASVKIEKADLASYYFYSDEPEFEEWLEELQYTALGTQTPDAALEAANTLAVKEELFLAKAAPQVVGFAVDNRIPNFGLKFVVDGAVENPLELLSPKLLQRFNPELRTAENITRRRYLDGLFETSDTDQTLLPFEANLDYINGLLLDKGCYVGQELTIRTFTGGVIRKRVVPVEFNCDMSDVDVAELEVKRPAAAQETRAVQRRGRLAKLVAAQKNRGFMLVLVAEVERDPNFEVLVGDQTVAVMAEIPSWWPQTNLE